MNMSSKFPQYSSSLITLTGKGRRGERYYGSQYDSVRGRPRNRVLFEEWEFKPKRSQDHDAQYFQNPSDAGSLVKTIYNEHSEHIPHSTNAIRQRNLNRLPFGKSMRKLHKQLVQAEQFCSNFQLEFDGDIQAIKNYAPVTMLSDLWRLKVSGGEQYRRTSMSSQETTHDIESYAEHRNESFETLQMKVIRCLEAATGARLVDAARLSRKNMSRLDSARRLQKKVDIANEQIRDLFKKAAKDRDYCEELLSELQLLNILIDPEIDKNKVLYKLDRREGDLSDVDG